MKKSMVLACLMACAATLHADYQKGNQSLQMTFGIPGYSDDVKVNNGDNTLRDCGGAGGFQYLYYIHGGPALAIGPDILWTDLSEHKNGSSLLPNSDSHGADYTAIYQSVLKLSYPKGHFRPYVLGGVGAFRSSVQGNVSTTETFDSVRYGFAGTWGLGFDIFPREHWFFGAELRQSILSRLLHEPTADGQSLGVLPVRDPGNITSILLRVGYKFGAN